MISTMYCFRKDDGIEGQLKTFLDIAQELDDKSSEQSRRIEELTGVAFNVKDFRAKRDVRIRWLFIRQSQDSVCLINAVTGQIRSY